jgi:hypothetical protein
VHLDPQTREARIQTQVITLGERNVLLIDDVDSATGPRIVGSVRVEPVFDIVTGTDMDRVVGRSPELVDFLRCDVAMADPIMQDVMARRCEQIRENTAPK